MRRLLLFLILVPNLAVAQSVFELDSIYVEGESAYSEIDKKHTDYALYSADSTQPIRVGNKNATEILVEYRGIKLNDSYNNTFNRNHLPSLLNHRLGLSLDSYSFMPKFEVNSDLGNQMSVTVGSDVSLEALLSYNGVTTWFTYDLNYYPYKDRQGSLRMNENSGLSKYGIMYSHDFEIDNSVLGVSTIFSLYSMTGIGSMEYLKDKKRTTESGLLFSVGLDYLSDYIQAFTYYKINGYRYQNLNKKDSYFEYVSDEFSAKMNSTYENIGKLDLGATYTYSGWESEDKRAHNLSFSLDYLLQLNNFSLKLHQELALADSITYPTVLSLEYEKSLLFRLGAYHGFKSPTLSDRYFQNEYIRPDEGLKSAEDYGLDLSVSKLFPHLNSNLTFAYEYLDGQIRYISYYANKFRVVNLPSYHTLSLEGWLKFNYYIFVVEADYKYTYLISDFNIPYLPAHTLFLKLGSDLDRWSVYINYTYKSPCYVSHESDVSVKSDHLLSVNGRYRYNNWSFVLEISNLIGYNRETYLMRAEPLFELMFTAINEF